MKSILVPKIKCSSPVFIVNPSLKTFLRAGMVLQYMDQCTIVSKEQVAMIHNGKSVFSVWLYVLPVFSYSAAEQCYFVSLDGGDIHPLFKAVPCGRCSACVEKKRFSLMQRCQMALEESHELPLFLTLTYNRKYCPKDVDKVAIQTFKKRLRKNLGLYLLRHTSLDNSHVGLILKSLKFVCVSEYGSLGRPHYHMVIFGFPRLCSNSFDNEIAIRRLLMFCWRDNRTSGGYMSFADYVIKYPKVFNLPVGYDPQSFGFINLQICRDSKSILYITKYMRKNTEEIAYADCVDPLTNKHYKRKTDFDVHGRKRNFCLVSHNLGVNFVSGLFPYLDKQSGKVSFTSWFDNVLYSVRLCSYYIHKLLPSYSELVPPAVRKRFYDIVGLCHDLSLMPSLPKQVQKDCLATSLFARNLFEPYLKFSFEDEQMTFFTTDMTADYALCLIPQFLNDLMEWVFSHPSDLIHKKILLREEYERILFSPIDTEYFGIDIDKQVNLLLSKSKLL